MPGPQPLRLLLLLWLFLGPLPRAFATPSASPSASPSATPSAGDPAALAAEQAELHLDAAGAVRLAGQQIRLGFARLYFDEGVFVPLKTSTGRTLELLFLGQGRLEVEPPDAIEAGQLELFTGQKRLTTGFHAAFFAGPEPRLLELRQGLTKAVLSADEKEEVKTIFAGRGELSERAVLDIDTQLLLATLGEPLATEFFAAILESDEHGLICLSHDLEAEDPLSLGQWMEVAAYETDPAVPGASDGDGVEESNVFDLWVAGRDPLKKAPAALTTFEPKHYDLHIELEPVSGKIIGEAKIDVEAQLPSRVVKLTLHGDLSIDAVRDEAGNELFFRREADVVRVFLPQKREIGQKAHLQVRYQGEFFEAGRKRKSRGLRENEAFYPHAGEIDEATYDFELRWPEGWEVLAAGDLVAEGQEGGKLWQKRRMGERNWGPTFVIGKFRSATRQVGGVQVKLAMGIGLGGKTQDLEEMLDAAATSLQYFSGLFGPYPGKELTLATAPAEYSQSFFGFIVLADEMMEASGAAAAELGIEDRRTVIAHEVAHQWWGHVIGWPRWRDLWFSESLANYSAHLWALKYLPNLDPEHGPNAAWQEDLTFNLPRGRSLESIGPLVVGHRLDSSLTADAYEPIVYRKGAIVFDSLAQIWGEPKFLDALGRLTREARGKRLSTEDLIAGLERHGGQSLQTFARSFIYGTGLPEIYYSWRSEKLPNGHSRITVETEAEPSYHFRHFLEETAEGEVAVRWRRQSEIELRDFFLVAPLRIRLAGEGKPRYREERFEQRGAKSTAVYEIEGEPAEVQLDPSRRVFARFWDRRSEPKKTLYYQGYDRTAAGDLAGARKAFVEGLKTSTPPGKDAKDSQKLDRALDASIYLGQARLDLLEGKLEAAATAIAAARKAVPKSFLPLYQKDLDYFAALLAWHQGRSQETFRTLDKLIFKKGEIDDNEAWLYLAMAAADTGEQETWESAIAELQARGINIDLLVDDGESTEEP